MNKEHDNHDSSTSQLDQLTPAERDLARLVGRLLAERWEKTHSQLVGTSLETRDPKPAQEM